MRSFSKDLTNYQPRNDLLNNRLIAITGATDGIGKALAIAATKLGSQLVLLAKNDKKLYALLDELSKITNTTHEIYTMDFATAGEQEYLELTNFLLEI